MKKLICSLGILLALPAMSQASIINFDFTGRLVVIDPSDNLFINNGLPYTPIAASLSYDTVSGLGNSALSITMNDPWFGSLATLHDISMVRKAGTNLFSGQVLVDWAGNYNMPLGVEWDATGLLNAISYGLQAGDTLSGSVLYHDTNGNGVQDAGEFLTDISSAIPYSDSLQLPADQQGAAPLAATSGSTGFDATTPFPGVRGYFDIGSGNSMHVTSVSTVPVPAAVWLFSSGLTGLIGAARRKKKAA